RSPRIDLSRCVHLRSVEGGDRGAALRGDLRRHRRDVDDEIRLALVELSRRRGRDAVRRRLRAHRGGVAARSLVHQRGRVIRWSTVLLLALAAPPVLAHITPPVTLVSDRAAVAALLPGAKRYFVREVRLTGAERAAIQQQTGWAPDEDFYRFYLGRDEMGREVGAVAFLSDYTIHGPVRVAVGLTPDGRIRGAKVVEVTEETYPWVKSLLDQGFSSTLLGRAPPPALRRPAGKAPMPGSFAEWIPDLRNA